MKSTIEKPAFANLPRDFFGLCNLHTPRPLHDKVDLDNATALADIMAGHEKQMTRDQDDYYELLCTLIEEYEREHFPEFEKKRVGGLGLLKHLLELNAMNASDFSRLLGADRTLGAKILRGERNLTIPHLRILARRFRVRPDVFV